MNHSRSKSSTSQATVYHLKEEHNGLTLSAALKLLVQDATWGQVKKWVKNRQTQVNGNLCLDPARRVTPKDVVKLWTQPLPKPVEASDIRIEFLDEHLLVVRKPAGITSVRHYEERKLSTRRRQLQPTLEELLPPVLAKMLKMRWPPLPPVGMNRGRRQTNLKQRHRGRDQTLVHNAKKLPQPLQIFPVHRLDRDTSGLMLFARTRAAEQKLVALFRKHAIVREYTAICQGRISPQTIESHLIRDRGDGQRGSLAPEEVGDRQDALPATTHVLKSEPFQSDEGADYSVLTCRLDTGRTHQIRIHLSERGHPICGDKIYHRLADGSSIADHSNAPRHALHSGLLRFVHPITGENHQFRMELPPDLSRWLNDLQGPSSVTSSNG